MKISGTHTFHAPRERVWRALLDPAILSTVLPGCERLKQSAENEFEGAIDLKVGPVQGKFQGKVVLESPQPPEGYTLQLDGRGAPGWVRATTAIQLLEEGKNTQMSYDGEAQVGGRIASVGQRLLDSSTRSIIRQSLEGLDRALAVQAPAGTVVADAEVALRAPSHSAATEATGAAATPAPTPAATPTAAPPAAPSQAEFAARVAKDVAKDMAREFVPRPVLVGGAILIVLAVLYLLLN